MACGVEAETPNLDERCAGCAAEKATMAWRDVLACEWRRLMLNAATAEKATDARSSVQARGQLRC
jgi:cell division protein FtsL